MAKRKENEPTPQARINQLLGTSNKAKQLEVLAALMGARPVTLTITANPITGSIQVATIGSPTFEVLYDMLDQVRREFQLKEKQALLEMASQTKQRATEKSDETT